MFKVRQKLGKYRIEKKLGDGGFATVYQVMDTIEGIRVALKVPQSTLVTDKVLEDFRREVRLLSRIEHPNILPLKDASIIEGHFVIAYPLGQRTLADRLRYRMTTERAMGLFEQLLAAVAHAHSEKIIHCDIKPENVLLFNNDRVRLADFGIAKVAAKTVRGAGTGTVGYMAPEQAMGKPSFRSDVFSLGLILYRMLSGYWMEWPFEWPGPGYQRIRRRINAEMIEVLRRSINPDPKCRYKDAIELEAALKKAKRKRRQKPKLKLHRNTTRRPSQSSRKRAA